VSTKKRGPRRGSVELTRIETETVKLKIDSNMIKGGGCHLHENQMEEGRTKSGSGSENQVTQYSEGKGGFRLIQEDGGREKGG